MENMYTHIANKYKSLFEYATPNDITSEETKQAITYTTIVINNLFKDLENKVSVDLSNVVGSILGVDRRKRKVINSGISTVDGYLQTAYSYINKNKNKINFGQLQQAVVGSAKQTLESAECTKLREETASALESKNEDSTEKLTIDGFILDVAKSLVGSLNSPTPVEYGELKKRISDKIAEYII